MHFRILFHPYMIELTKYNVQENGDSSFEVSGDNQKGVVVVYPSYTSSDGIKLLKTIVEKAIMCDINKDVLMISLKEGGKFSLSQLLIDYKIKNIICFGIKPRDLTLNFEHIKNQIINFNNIQFIFTDDLDQISENQSMKKLFWSCLKNSSLT